MPAAYTDQIERMVEPGAAIGDATCGMTDVAGISVGAAFVGETAGSLAIGGVLRHLHGADLEVAVLSLDLRNPAYLTVVPHNLPRSYFNPGWTAAR